MSHASHFIRDCPQGSIMMCFHYIQVGHKKANYMRMMSGAVQVPSLVTLRLSVGHDGGAKVTGVRSRAFQLRAKETRVLPDIVADMYRICFVQSYIVLIMIMYLCV